jgi:hypothetical protein
MNEERDFVIKYSRTASQNEEANSIQNQNQNNNGFFIFDNFLVSSLPPFLPSSISLSPLFFFNSFSHYSLFFFKNATIV